MARELRFIDPAFSCEVVVRGTSQALFQVAATDFDRLKGLRSLGLGRQGRGVEVWIWGVTTEANITKKRTDDTAKIQKLKDLLGNRWDTDVRACSTTSTLRTTTSFSRSMADRNVGDTELVIRRGPETPQAELAVSVAGAMAAVLVSTWDEQRRGQAKDEPPLNQFPSDGRLHPRYPTALTGCLRSAVPCTRFVFLACEACVGPATGSARGEDRR